MALIKSRPVAAFRVFACWRGSGEDVPPSDSPCTLGNRRELADKGRENHRPQIAR